MQSQFFACVLAVVVLVGPSTAVASAQEASKFVGTWKGKIDTHDEIWTIKSSNGTLSVNGKLRKNGLETGSFIGKDVKEEDGMLTFTRKFVKKPNGEWSDEAKFVVKSEGENLSYAWTAGQLKGTRALEKFEEGDKPPADDELGKFRGSWTADVATGFHVVMQITMKKDKIEVSANYYNKKNQLVGNFTGADVAIKDGFLMFTQKFGTKPVNSWMDGKKHTLEIVSDTGLKFSWEKGGVENFTRVKK